MRGLDPRIHHFEKYLFRWIAGSSPAMTNSGVPGLVRQHAGIDADLAQRALVFFIDVVAEYQLRVGVAMQPAIVLDLVLELARRPAGIAQRQDRVLRSGALGDRL